MNVTLPVQDGPVDKPWTSHFQNNIHSVIIYLGRLTDQSFSSTELDHYPVQALIYTGIYPTWYHTILYIAIRSINACSDIRSRHINCPSGFQTIQSYPLAMLSSMKQNGFPHDHRYPICVSCAVRDRGAVDSPDRLPDQRSVV